MYLYIHVAVVNTALLIIYCYIIMQTVAKKVALSDSNKKYFALFLRTEHDFGKINHCTVQCMRHIPHVLFSLL